jgi:hypothetical protein
MTRKTLAAAVIVPTVVGLVLWRLVQIYDEEWHLLSSYSHGS